MGNLRGHDRFTGRNVVPPEFDSVHDTRMRGKTLPARHLVARGLKWENPRRWDVDPRPIPASVPALARFDCRHLERPRPAANDCRIGSERCRGWPQRHPVGGIQIDAPAKFVGTSTVTSPVFYLHRGGRAGVKTFSSGTSLAIDGPHGLGWEDALQFRDDDQVKSRGLSRPREGRHTATRTPSSLESTYAGRRVSSVLAEMRLHYWSCLSERDDEQLVGRGATALSMAGG